jgi:IS30 family transposase
MSHIQFNRDTRIGLATMLSCNKNHSESARKLGMNRSSVSNEIKRYIDDDGIYRGSHAHNKYLANRKRVKQIERKIENNKKLRRYIVRKLKLKWSPEQIAGRLNRIFGYTIICHETIYTFVYGQRKDLVKHVIDNNKMVPN